MFTNLSETHPNVDESESTSIRPENHENPSRHEAQKPKPRERSQRKLNQTPGREEKGRPQGKPIKAAKHGAGGSNRKINNVQSRKEESHRRINVPPREEESGNVVNEIPLDEGSERTINHTPREEASRRKVNEIQRDEGSKRTINHTPREEASRRKVNEIPRDEGSKRTINNTPREEGSRRKVNEIPRDEGSKRTINHTPRGGQEGPRRRFNQTPSDEKPPRAPKMWVIFHNLEESQTEDPRLARKSDMDKLRSILKRVSVNATLSLPTRLGQRDDSTPRPLRVQVMKKEDVDKIMESSKAFDSFESLKGVYVTTKFEQVASRIVRKPEPIKSLENTPQYDLEAQGQCKIRQR